MTRIKKPRYVRVNVLKMDMDSAVSYLIEEGWTQKENINFMELTPNDFAVDNFVDNLLVFSHGTELYKHPLYLDGAFVLQDKVCLCYTI